MIDDDEFNKNVVDCIKHLERMSYKYYMCEQDREDLVYGTVLKMLENKNKYSVIESKNFVSWAFIVMRNLFLNRMNSCEYRNMETLPNDELYLLREQIGMQYGADSETGYNELMDVIDNVITKRKYHDVFIAYINGYQYEQISKIFCINIGSVKSIIFNCKRDIKEYLDGDKDKKGKYCKVQG